MKILVIGGTIFLGRHITENAVTRGHTITAFFRGKRIKAIFPDCAPLADMVLPLCIPPLASDMDAMMLASIEAAK